MREVPVEYLRECFDYDPLTGKLTWRVRPREHFSSDKEWRRWNTRYAGHVSGGFSSSGYLNVVIMVGGRCCCFGSQHIAWTLVTGVWPLVQVDHKNGNRSDNRFKNLREATHAEQTQNVCLRRDSTSGFMGVSWHKLSRKWEAHIRVNGRQRHLGLFSTSDLASTAYLEAKRRLHPFQPVPRAA
jgi:HNH endonuclease/AP2 domain